MLTGFDTSQYNTKGYEHARDYGEFNIIRATIGNKKVDKKYISRITELISAGKNAGVYHYMNNTSPTEQATHFFNTIKNVLDIMKSYHGYRIPFVCALDVEYSGWKVADVVRFCDTFKRLAGFYPVVYMSWSGYCKMYGWCHDYNFWIARWNNNTSSVLATFRQYPNIIGWQRGVFNLSNKKIELKDIKDKGVDYDIWLVPFETSTRG